MNKANQSVASINQKLYLQKVNFNSAQQLFNSIVFPASTYGLETYLDELFEIEIKQHYRKIEAVFLEKLVRSKQLHLNHNAFKQIEVS